MFVTYMQSIKSKAFLSIKQTKTNRKKDKQMKQKTICRKPNCKYSSTLKGNSL